MALPDDPFRSFALAVYRCDGVSRACLRLQDRFDVDVNILLFAAYLVAARGGEFFPASLAAAQSRVGAWHREVVIPLRQLRRRLKEGPSPAPDDRTATLRTKVKQLELEAEFIELDELGALARSMPTANADGDSLERVCAAIDVVLRLESPDAVTWDDREAIKTIGAAAVGIGAPR